MPSMLSDRSERQRKDNQGSLLNSYLIGNWTIGSKYSQLLSNEAVTIVTREFFSLASPSKQYPHLVYASPIRIDASLNLIMLVPSLDTADEAAKLYCFQPRNFCLRHTRKLAYATSHG